MSAWLRITIRMLPKSCAMPAASRPMISVRCSCRRRSSAAGARHEAARQGLAAFELAPARLPFELGGGAIGDQAEHHFGVRPAGRRPVAERRDEPDLLPVRRGQRHIDKAVDRRLAEAAAGASARLEREVPTRRRLERRREIAGRDPGRVGRERSHPPLFLGEPSRQSRRRGTRETWRCTRRAARKTGCPQPGKHHWQIVREPGRSTRSRQRRPSPAGAQSGAGGDRRGLIAALHLTRDAPPTGATLMVRTRAIYTPKIPL